MKRKPADTLANNFPGHILAAAIHIQGYMSGFSADDIKQMQAQVQHTADQIYRDESSIVEYQMLEAILKYMKYYLQ